MAAKTEEKALLEAGYENLKDQLSLLEKENEKLHKDLVRKRKERAERLRNMRAEKKQSTKTLGSLDRYVEHSMNRTQKHQLFLSSVRKLQKRQENVLQAIKSKMDQIEQKIQNGEISVPDMKARLTNMLEDIQKLKQDRQAVENKLADLQQGP